MCETLIIAAENGYTALDEKRVEAIIVPESDTRRRQQFTHGTPFDAIEKFNAHVIEFLSSN